MREFIALAENLNYSHTAEKLFITQPALSRHITAIENHIGIQLIKRTTHSVELTPMGTIVVNEFKKIVKQYENILTQASLQSSGFTGNIRIGMLCYAVSEYMTPIMMFFKEKHPSLKLLLSSYQPNQLIQDLLNDRIDVGFTFHEYFPHAERLIFHDIHREKLVVIVSNKHPFALRKSIDISDLKGQLLIFLGNQEWHKLRIEKLLASQGIKPINFTFTDQIDTVSFTIKETNGIFIAPRHLKSMSLSDTAFIELNNEDFFIDISVAYRANNDNTTIPLFINQLGRIFAQDKTHSKKNKLPRA
jgi:DNA-binding transcriptional LysR family regulator